MWWCGGGGRLWWGGVGMRCGLFFGGGVSDTGGFGGAAFGSVAFESGRTYYFDRQ